MTQIFRDSYVSRFESPKLPEDRYTKANIIQHDYIVIELIENPSFTLLTKESRVHRPLQFKKSYNSPLNYQEAYADYCELVKGIEDSYDTIVHNAGDYLKRKADEQNNI